MYKFETHYKRLMVHVEGETIRFENGIFLTEDKKVAEALKKVADVTLVEEPKKVEEKPKKTSSK